MAMLLGSASAQVTLDVSQFMAAAGQAEGAMNQLANAGGRGTPGFLSRLNQGALGLGTVLIAPMTLGIATAAQLEQGLAGVDAALGDISDADLSVLADQFNQIGINSQFSAVEIAGIGEELAKAGFDMSELEGATQAVVDLSQATGADLPTSINAVTAAMNTWSPEIVDSSIALTDATRVADIFTVAANNSSASVGDIAAGMRPLGPVAAGLGIGMDEAAAAIALFTNYGITGADAGISLARGLENLANPTAEATQLMADLGISAFDASGEFVGLPSLFGQLQTAMGGMSDEAKLAALSTLFGAEAADVMALAIQTGADPLQLMIDLMGQSGAAAEQSAIRMNTFSAKLDTLKEGVATVLGSFVSGLLPAGKIALDFANNVIDAMLGIPPAIKTVIGAIAGLLAAYAGITRAVQTFRALNGVMNLLGGNSVAAAAASRGLLGTLLRFVPALALISLGFLAWETNMFGVQDAARAFVRGFRHQWRLLGDMDFGPVAKLLSAVGVGFEYIGKQGGPLAPLATRIGSAFRETARFTDALGNALGEVWRTGELTASAIAGIPDPLQDATRGFLRMVDAGFDLIRAFGDDGLRGLWRALPGEIAQVASGFTLLGSEIGQAIRAIDIRGVAVNIVSWAAGAIADLWPYVQEWASALVDGAASVAATVWNVLVNIGSWAKGVVSDLVPYIAMWADTAASGIVTAAATVWNVLINVGSWAKGVVSDLWPYVTMWAADAMSGIAGAAGTLWNVLVNIGSWAKGIVSDLWPYITMWATEAMGGISGAAGTLWGVIVNVGSWAAGEIAPLATWLAEQIGIEDFTPVGNTVGAKVMSAISIAFSAGTAAGGATGGVFNIGASILGWINRQIESQLDGGFEAVGQRIGQALAAATASFLSDGTALTPIGSAFARGVVTAVGDEISESGFSDQFWRAFENIGQAGGEVFEGIAEGFIQSFMDAIAPDGSMNLPGGLTINVSDIDFGGSLATAFKHAFIESAMPGSTMDLDGVKVAIDDLDFGDLQGAFKDAFIAAAIPGGSITLDVLNIDVGDLNWLFPEGDPEDPVNPGLEPQPAPESDPQNFFGGYDFGGIHVALDGVISKAREASGALAAVFGGGGRGAAGGGAGIDAGGTVAAITAVQTALTSLTTTAQTAAMAMGLAGLQAGQAFTTGISAGITTGVAVVANSMAIIVTVVASSMAGMAATATTGMALVRGAVASGMAAVVVAVANGMATARTVTAAGAAAMAASMVAGMAMFRGAVISGMATAVGAVRAGIAAMVAAASAGRGMMMSAGLGIGAALGQGIAAGIQSQIGAVAAAAAALVSAAVGAARSAGAISSPSKVMRDEIGYNLSLGVAEGIYDGLPVIYRASARMIPTLPASAFRANSAPFGGGAVTHTTVIHAPVTIEGNVTTEERIVENAAVHISEAIIQRTQQRNIGLGVRT